MPNPQQPDTSNKAVAEILRHLADVANPCEDAACVHIYCVYGRTARALADALERQAGGFRGALTVEDRYRLSVAYVDNYRAHSGLFASDYAEDIIRVAIAAAFPELAPQHAPTESESDDR